MRPGNSQLLALSLLGRRLVALGYQDCSGTFSSYHFLSKALNIASLAWKYRLCSFESHIHYSEHQKNRQDQRDALLLFSASPAVTSVSSRPGMFAVSDATSDVIRYSDGSRLPVTTFDETVDEGRRSIQWLDKGHIENIDHCKC